MVEKYFDSKIPQPGKLNEKDQIIVEIIKKSSLEADEAMCKLDFSEGILAIKKIVDAANLYVTEQEPWKLAKDEANKERLATVLYCVAEALRAISVLYHPVMPKATEKIWHIIGANETIGKIAQQKISEVGTWAKLPFSMLILSIIT